MQTAVGERVGGVAGLLDRPLVEGIGVDDDRAAGGQVVGIYLQGRRVSSPQARSGHHPGVRIS